MNCLTRFSSGKKNSLSDLHLTTGRTIMCYARQRQKRHYHPIKISLRHSIKDSIFRKQSKISSGWGLKNDSGRKSVIWFRFFIFISIARVYRWHHGSKNVVWKENPRFTMGRCIGHRHCNVMIQVFCNAEKKRVQHEDLLILKYRWRYW